MQTLLFKSVPDFSPFFSRGLRAWLPCQEIAGDSAYDHSFNRKHAPYSGNVSRQFFKGTLCLDFDGTDDYLDLTALDDWNPSDLLTVMCWANVDSWLNSVGRMINKSSFWATDTNAFPFQLQTIVSGGNKFQWSLSQGDDFSSDLSIVSPTVSAGQWYHVAATFKQNGTSYLYVDGREVASGASNFALSSSSHPWRIGASVGVSGGANDHEFDGKMADVRIYDRQLSHAEIWAIYKETRKWLFHGASLFEGDFISEEELAASVAIPIFHHHYQAMRTA